MAEQYLNKEGVQVLWTAVKGKISTAQTTVENEFVNGTKKAKYAQQADNIGGIALSGLVQSIKVGSKTFSPKNSVVTLDDYALSTHTHTFASLTSKPTTISGYGITDAYTKTESDGKYASKATTLSGYGITDAYTKTESDGKYVTKTDSDTKYQPKGTYATLDEDGKVPSSQLPSYVDDVIEGYYSNGKFYSDSAKTKEISGEGGKIYTDLTSNKTYRWGGTAWVEISASLAIGETAGTAYDGAKGAKNASDIATLKSVKADKVNTLAGYGITDAYTKTESDNKYQPKGNYASATHTHTFDSLMSKPTTLSGYGITDAVPAVNDIGRINNTVVGIVSVSCGDDNMLFLGTDSSTSDYAYLKGKNEVVIMAHNSDESTTSYGGITIYPGSRPNALIDGIEQPMAIKADLPTAISTADLNTILV